MQITDHVHALRIPFQVFTPNGALDRFVIVYLIVGETVWLIDAGVAGAEEAIAAYLCEIGREIGEVRTLVLTHSHPDHVGGARAIQAMTGCSVLAHPAERAWIEDVALQARERPVPGFERLVGGSVPINRLLEHGDSLAVGEGLTLDVLHTPGHSQGSISLFLREEGALFSGDAVPLAGDLPIFESVSQSTDSIQRLCDVPGMQVLLAAWDEPRWGDAATARMDDGLAWLETVEAAVREARAAPNAEDPLALCRNVLSSLGMPPEAANPLVARTFAPIR